MSQGGPVGGVTKVVRTPDLIVSPVLRVSLNNVFTRLTLRTCILGSRTMLDKDVMTVVELDKRVSELFLLVIHLFTEVKSRIFPTRTDRSTLYVQRVFSHFYECDEIST